MSIINIWKHHKPFLVLVLSNNVNDVFTLMENLIYYKYNNRL